MADVKSTTPTRRPSRHSLADGEVHELTRGELRQMGFEEFRQFRGWLRSYARPRPELQLTIQQTEGGVKFCMGVPPLKWQAPHREAWRGNPVTAPKLARYILNRMKANRHRQYLFTREWIAGEYRNTSPEIIDAALQHLVEQGKISAIPK